MVEESEMTTEDKTQKSFSTTDSLVQVATNQTRSMPYSNHWVNCHFKIRLKNLKNLV